MKRDIFKRPVRMVHQFGATERINDPFGTNTFDTNFPVLPRQRSAPLEIHQQGEAPSWRSARSPVQKPNGSFASLEGPALEDMGASIGRAVPVSTVKRKQP